MSNKKEFLRITLTFLCGVLLLVLLNMVTSPIIENNKKKGEFEPLFSVFPGAENFAPITLANTPDTVRAVYEETSGKGYVLKCATNKGFTGNYITLTLGITKDGKVAGIKLDEYPETKDFGSDYPTSFIGADSTLSTTEIVAGVTYSSTAFRNAVADAFDLLASNGLIVAQEKSPEQKFEEMLTTVFGEAVNPKGLLVAEDFTSSISQVVLAKKAGNNTAIAYLVNDGGTYYTVVSNIYSLSVYDMDGKSSTSLSSSIKDALLSEAESSLKDNSKSDLKKIKKLGSLSDDAVYTLIPLDGIDTSVTTIYSIESDEKLYYGFVARPYGFGNETMVMYTLLTEDGKIADFSVKELIIEADYFSSYTLSDNYLSSFTGLDSSWSGEEAIISGATLTSEAVKDALNDTFSAYDKIKEGK